MFKFLMSLIAGGAMLTVPTVSGATHCENRQNVVFNDHADYVVQEVRYAVVAPHAKVVERVVFNDYDYQPVAVEKIVVRERQQVVKQVVQKQRQRVQQVRQRVKVRRAQNVQKVIVREQVIINGHHGH